MAVFGTTVYFADENFESIGGGADPTGISIALINKKAEAGSQIVGKAAKILIGSGDDGDIVTTGDNVDRIAGAGVSDNFLIT